MGNALATQDNIILTDAFQRQFSYLRLSITDLCNFKCSYCLPNGYQGKASQNELSLEEIKTLIASFAKLGFKKIRLTGGEPSLRKDLLEIIQICKSQPGIEKVCITTNGYVVRASSNSRTRKIPCRNIIVSSCYCIICNL